MVDEGRRLGQIKIELKMCGMDLPLVSMALYIRLCDFYDSLFRPNDPVQSTLIRNGSSFMIRGRPTKVKGSRILRPVGIATEVVNSDCDRVRNLFLYPKSFYLVFPFPAKPI